MGWLGLTWVDVGVKVGGYVGLSGLTWLYVGLGACLSWVEVG